MKWVRKKSTLHVADGSEGTFYIEESRRGGRRLFWVKYRSKKPGGKNFNMPPSSSIVLAKFAAEESYYWEGESISKKRDETPRHAAAPSRAIKRWDMEY